MRVAEHVAAGVAAIRNPPVMHTRAPKRGQDAQRLHGLPPPLRVDAIVRQLLCRGCVQPPACALHTEPCFIVMQQRPRPQRLHDLRLHVRETRCRLLHPGRHRSRRERRAQEVAQHRLCPVVRQEVLLRQADRRRPHARAVLHRSAHSCREGPCGQRAAARTAHAEALVLRDLQTHRRQVLHLPPLHARYGQVRQRRRAPRADRGALALHPVRHRAEAQGRARVLWLSAWPLPARAAQAARTRPPSVLGRRLAAVLAVRPPPSL